MKRYVSLVIIVVIIILTSSCYIEGRGYYHRWIEYKYNDEYNYYCDNYYIINKETASEVDFIVYESKTSNIIDHIYLTKKEERYVDYSYISKENIIYIFIYYINMNKVVCYYKTLGSDEDINLQYVEVDSKQKFIEVKDLSFMIDFNADIIPSSFICYKATVNIKNYNIIQTGLVYSSLKDENEIYDIDVDEKEITITNYYDEAIRYTYPISQEVKDAKYLSKRNMCFDDWGVHINEEEVSHNTYALVDKTTKLMNDGNLYFAYGRYLGEFERAYCRSFDNCILSNRICEILRFNTQNKQIERVTLIPETYTVLAIYEDCAIIMNNERIGTYYYDTKELKDSIEVDIVGKIYETEYELPDINAIRFYFKDKKIERYEAYKSYNYIINKKSNILFLG